MFPYKYCGMDTRVLRELHELWGLRVGDPMRYPLGNSLVHRGKSGAQKPAGLGTLSEPTKNCILLMVGFAWRLRSNLFAVAEECPLSVRLAQGRVLFCPGTWDLQMVADVELSQMQR